MKIHGIRWMPASELIVQKSYWELVPRPSAEDYKRLKDSIEKYGLNPSWPTSGQ